MKTVEVEDLVIIKGVPFPAGERFRQIIVTGPPGSGKSTLIATIGGWPEEGYLDLAQMNWWRNPILTFRPREIHFGFPFEGHPESLAVFEKKWLDSPSNIDFKRIKIPTKGRELLGSNWQEKYVFDFQLPAPELIYATRRKRAERDTHLVDQDLTLIQVQHQVAIHADLALFFHRKGLKVFIRNSFQGTPRRFVES